MAAHSSTPNQLEIDLDQAMNVYPHEEVIMTVGDDFQHQQQAFQFSQQIDSPEQLQNPQFVYPPPASDPMPSLEEYPIADRSNEQTQHAVEDAEEEREELPLQISSNTIDHNNNLPETPPQQLTNEFEANRSTTASNSLREDVKSIRRSLATDSKTPTEYTLHILFTQFVRHAERKLNLCLNYSLQSEPPIVDLLAEGVDPNFDKIIASLGYISKKNPKPVIDSVMFWRKSKAEVASMASEAVDKAAAVLKQYKENTSFKKQHGHSSSTVSRFSHKRNNSSKSSVNSADPKLILLEQQVQSSRETAIQGDRKSLISIYILCRVLIEIVKQVDFDITGDDLGVKLEEIVFSQLRSTDPILISSSIIRSASWNLFAELLGYMSEKRFLSVSDRFIAELEKIPPNVPKEIEPSMHLLIHGMRYLRLKSYPPEDFEESADFLLSISKFFNITRSHSIKLAYSQVLTYLLLPLAESLTAEVNHPTWVEAITRLYKTCHSIDFNQKGWTTTLTLLVSVLCVSPNELFLGKWYDLMESMIKTFKSKQTTQDEKAVIAAGIPRLLWVYVFRCTESLNNTTRKIDGIVKTLFFSKGKPVWSASDFDTVLPFVQIFRIIGYASHSATMENYIITLLRSSFNSNSGDNIQHEKAVLAIRSYISILADTERPEFPENVDSLSDPDIHLEVKDGYHEEMWKYIDSLLVLLDKTVGRTLKLQTPQDSQQSSGASFMNGSRSPFVSFKFGSEVNVQVNRALNLELLSVVIEAIPWTMHGFPRNVIEILCRNSLHTDIEVAKSARNSLKLLVSKKNAYSLISYFAKFAFNFDERSNYSQSYLISKELLRLYYELLEFWLAALQNIRAKKENQGQNFQEQEETDQEKKLSDELQWKNAITVVEEVEGHGLFFLASQDFEVRKIGLSILKIVELFDQALYDQTTSKGSQKKLKHKRSNSKFAADIGTRVYFTLQTTDFLKLINTQKQHLSTAERSRLTKLTQKPRRDNLIRIAESDYGVDAALWFRVFPKILSICFERCPVTMALCRSIVCTRLVQIHEPILEIAKNFKDGERIAQGPAEVLIEQWKLYLIVACTSLTSTGEQRLHIPNSVVNSHKKKKSQQLLTIQHSTITSARSVFKLTLNLLSSSNHSIRDAIFSGLSCMNINIFKTFIESVDPIFSKWEEQAESKNTPQEENILRIEVVHVLNVVTRFMEDDSIIEDEWIISRLIHFIKIVKSFLSQPQIQVNFEFQRLRRYFCGLLENVYSGLQKTEDPGKWLPFEARVACFTFLKEWCGYGKYAIISKNRYLKMSSNVSNSQDSAAINSAIEFEKQYLSLSATNCMVALLNGKIKELRGQTILKFDLSSLWSWIDILLNSSNERISGLAKKALQSLFKHNEDDEELFSEIFNKCIVDQKVSIIENYYVNIAQGLIASKEYPLKKHEILLLALYGCGFNNLGIRSNAIALLVDAEKRLFGTELVGSYTERVLNTNKTIYKRALLEISTYFASAFPDENIFLISELTKHFHIVSFEARRDILTILMPWLQTVELKVTEEEIDINSYMVLTNLFEITVKFSETIPNEIEALWMSLGNGANLRNVNAILLFVIQTSLVKRSPIFVEFGSKVLVYLSTSTVTLANSLVGYIEPKMMVPPVNNTFEPAAENSENPLPYVADLWKSFNLGGNDAVFSLGQLALIFLSDLVVIPRDSLTCKIPILLHLSFVLLDHYLPVVQEAAAKMIIYLLSTVTEHPLLEGTKDRIRYNQKTLWVYDDLNSDKGGSRSPKDMDLLVRNILEIFSVSYPTLQAEWGRVALSWATTCAVRHIACRSFQVFRSLLSFLDQSMLRDMLHRLSNTISDETPDIQGFSMQILMTLNAITSELDAEKLIDFPQLFWCTVASLNTINEHEYIELLSALSKFLSKIDLDSEDTVSCLVSTFPPNWEGKFEGLQPIIMIGLRSSLSWDASLKLLDRLNKLKDSDIIADKTRLLFAFLANIPRYLHDLDEEGLSPEIIESANTLIEMANNHGETTLARIIDSFSKNKFRSKDDFLSQTINYITVNYLNNYSGQIVIFLLGLLSNKLDWVKIETMNVLKLLFPKIDFSEPQFQGCGADLISPLLRLLLTPYAEQALEVLDETTSISGSKLDKDILRMSLGNKAIKKDYEKTVTLFGVPEESGWSIPMPALTTVTTRNNVHAVYLSCVALVENESPENKQEQEQIKFHMEEYNYNATPVDNVDNASVVDDAEGSLSHMWAELDNLDSFFTKDAETYSNYSNATNEGGHGRSTSADTDNTDQLTPFESAPQIYDKKVSVILNRSLARTASNTSFKTSLADSFGSGNISPNHEKRFSGNARDLRNRSSNNTLNSTITGGTSVINTVNSGTTGRYYGGLNISSPNLNNNRGLNSRSPELKTEDLFRFDGLIGPPTIKKKNRFTTAPEYLTNWSQSSPSHKSNSAVSPSGTPTSRSIRERSFMVREKKLFQYNNQEKDKTRDTNGINSIVAAAAGATDASSPSFAANDGSNSDN